MRTKIFAILALSIFSAMLGAGIIAPLLPLYADQMGATGISLGVIMAAFSISNIVAAPIFGRLSDRSGRKPFLIIGLLSVAIISLGYIWADNVFQLTLVRLVHGAAAGMIIPIAQAYVGDILPRGEEGMWMGAFNAAFFSGFGFGPLLGGILTEHLGMASAFTTMGGLNFLAFLGVILFLPESSRRKLATSSGSSFRQMRTSGIIKGVFTYRVSYAIGRGSFFTFLPIFATLYLDLSISLIGILLATNMLLTSLLQGLSGRIADRFNRKSLVILGGIIYIAFLACVPMTDSFWQLIGLCVFGGLSGAIATPAASALMVDEGRIFGMGSTMAVYGMAFGIGMAIGPLMGGGIIDLVNISSVFYVASGTVLIGTTLFVWFTRRYTLRSQQVPV